MGKKDKKGEAAKEARAVRQLKKAEKGEKKGGKADGEGDEEAEDDIDAILAEFARKEEKKTAVHVSLAEQPSARANFSLTPLPNGDMVMFGGEFCDGAGTTVFNDVLRWNVDKAEWRKVDSLNTPPPRCSHQALFFNEKIYVFGGEYATLDQFHHYRDLWELDIKTNSWREIQATGECPSARSGHRMCVWRGYMVLFGGFYEQKKENANWYNDTFIFSFQEEKWHQMKYKAKDHVPRVRSGHQMVLHAADDCLYLYGGFSKEKMAIQQDNTRKEAHVHDDLWTLSLKPVLGLSTPAAAEGTDGGGKKSSKKSSKSAGSDDSPVFNASLAQWTKCSRKGGSPSIRSGAVMTAYKNKAILFGGVYDEDTGHGLKSVFHSDVYSFDLASSKWKEIIISDGKSSGKSASAGDKDKEDSDSDDNDDVPANVLTRLAQVSLDQVNLAELGSIGRYFNKNFASAPCPRINPAIFTKGSRLYVYGGVTELDDVEVALDDCWCADISKRDDGWTRVLAGTMDNFEWKGVVDNATEGTLSDDEDDMEVMAAGCGRSTGARDDNDDDEDSDDDVDASGDKDAGAGGAEKVSAAVPAEGEPLRDFYNRTSDHWLGCARERMQPISTEASDKEINVREKDVKRSAFILAEVVFNANK